MSRRMVMGADMDPGAWYRVVYKDGGQRLKVMVGQYAGTGGGGYVFSLRPAAGTLQLRQSQLQRVTACQAAGISEHPMLPRPVR